MKFLLAWTVLASAALATGAGAAPLPVDILNAAERKVGEARIHFNYVVLFSAAGEKKGAIGVVMVQGRARLFLVGSDEQRTLVGWAEGRRLFNSKGELIGYYNWTPTWSYVYDKDLKKLGQAQCLAYQGVCAAGIAGFLLGLL